MAGHRRGLKVPPAEISLIAYLCTAPWGGTHGRLWGSADTPCPAPCGPEDTPPSSGAGAAAEARRSSHTGCCWSRRTSSPGRSGDTPGLLDQPCGEAPVPPVSPPTQTLKHGEDTHGEAAGLRNPCPTGAGVPAISACFCVCVYVSVCVCVYICSTDFPLGYRVCL